MTRIKTQDMVAYQKDYRQVNKEALSQYQKQYRENHKNELMQKSAELIECEYCKCQFRRDGLAKHIRTKLHQLKLEQTNK